MAKKSSGGTPATVALTKAGVAFTVHPYAHSDGVTNFGEEAAAVEGTRRALYDAPIERPSRVDVRPGAERTFQCRDALWEEFAGMAGEIGCRIDELINEAMEEHLRVLGSFPAA